MVHEIQSKPDMSGKMARMECTTMKGKTYVVVFSNKTFDVVNHIIVIHRKGRTEFTGNYHRFSLKKDLKFDSSILLKQLISVMLVTNCDIQSKLCM